MKHFPENQWNKNFFCPTKMSPWKQKFRQHQKFRWVGIFHEIHNFDPIENVQTFSMMRIFELWIWQNCGLDKIEDLTKLWIWRNWGMLGDAVGRRLNGWQCWGGKGIQQGMCDSVMLRRARRVVYLAVIKASRKRVMLLKVSRKRDPVGGHVSWNAYFVSKPRGSVEHVEENRQFWRRTSRMWNFKEA